MQINLRKAACRIATILLVTAWGGTIPLCLAQSSADQQVTPDRTARDLSREVEELRNEVETLRAQVAALKSIAYSPSGPGTPRLLNAAEILPARVQDAPATAAAPAQNAATTPASTSTPGTSLATLLGSTTLSGFVDGYYQQSFENPTTRTNGLRTFDALTNQFGLNLIELVVDKPAAENSRTGYHVALGFGQAMNVVNGADPGGLAFSQYLKEGYFSYLAPIGKGLQVDFGKFVTPAGAEVIESKDNWNYSRGLLFDFAIPFFHYGMRAKYAFNDKVSLTGYLVNGWNNVVENNTGKTYGMSLAWNPNKKWGFTENYLAGPEGVNNNQNWRQLADTVVTYSPTAKLSLMANYDYGRGDRITAATKPVWWSGFAGYLKYAINSQYTFATRYEYYDDHNGFTTGIPATATTPFIPTPQHLNGVTGTFERTIANHIISRFEYRRDMSNQPVFAKGVTPVRSQNTVTGGLIFVFDSKEKSN
jgi:hypothetical protein